MKNFKYFQINNINFNYDLEFQTNNSHESWKLNAPLIDYCETLGVNIPHYCYHKSLSISGNCRMCLVELKNSPKPIVSCSMSAKACLNNGAVYTNSPLVKKARENVLEFLLLNHPLDCPICDQGGECDLQDQSFFFGVDKKRFYNFKRIVTDKNIGIIVKTVMTRCIHCTRCVRFANEIAGVPNLGMFGRGLNSEIGTYVKKTFQSELSGNVIDLCPVGALTSKPYPFVSRSWELKSVNSLDFTDGFGSNTQVYLKNNRITKILPGYENHSIGNNWISDKTRFAFDGMFSPNRIPTGVLKINKKTVKLGWEIIFQEIVDTFYIHDQLNRHIYDNSKLLLIFDNNISLETLNMLLLFSKKFSFVSLKKTENNTTVNDVDDRYLIKTDQIKLDNSSLCFLVGTNPRYEGSILNTMLRRRVLRGEFDVISLGSSINLTYPSTSTGLTNKTLQQIVEGNHPLTQKLLMSIAPNFIISTEAYTRHDNLSFTNMLNFLDNRKATYFDKPIINTLNLSINESGTRYLTNFSSVKNKDFDQSNGVYFLNASQSTSANLKKILNLKLLSASISTKNNLPKYCLEQSNGTIGHFFKTMPNNYQLYNYINLPNANIFESNGTYLTTTGIFKKNIKFLSTPAAIKEDWQIIRKIFSQTSKIQFTSNFKDNNVLFFNSSTLNKFNKFTDLINKATSSMSKSSNGTIQTSGFKNVIKSKLKKTKTKVFGTKLKLWLNDFYIDGKDSYSKQSITMINCSKVLRSEKSNFNNVQ